MTAQWQQTTNVDYNFWNCCHVQEETRFFNIPQIQGRRQGAGHTWFHGRGFPSTCRVHIVILASARDCCHSYAYRSCAVSTLAKVLRSPTARQRHDSTSGRRMKSNLFAHRLFVSVAECVGDASHHRGNRIEVPSAPSTQKSWVDGVRKSRNLRVLKSLAAPAFSVDEALVPVALVEPDKLDGVLVTDGVLGKSRLPCKAIVSSTHSGSCFAESWSTVLSPSSMAHLASPFSRI